MRKNFGAGANPNPVVKTAPDVIPHSLEKEKFCIKLAPAAVHARAGPSERLSGQPKGSCRVCPDQSAAPREVTASGHIILFS